MEEVNLLPVDLGLELRQRVQLGLELAPVVIRRPIARERLDRRPLHALRAIVDQLPRGQPHRGDATTKFLQGLVRNLDVERVNFGGGLGGDAHHDLLLTE
jgi:hypothetical protein